MVRERTPAKSSARAPVRSQIGDSWVVETNESDSDDEYTPPRPTGNGLRSEPPRQSRKTSTETAQAPRRRPRPTTRASASAEPELIMPSLQRSGVGNSWIVKEKWRDDSDNERPAAKSADKEKRKRPSKAEETTQDAARKAAVALWENVKPALFWTNDVLRGSLQMLKGPISVLISLWVLFGVLIFLRNLFFTSVYSALSPICRIPGTQYLELPMCKNVPTTRKVHEEGPPVEFDKLMTVQDQFEAILQESAGGVSLPLDMKRGETSIRDLRQIVRFSQLRSKNELVLEFDGFIETARMASYDLQKFNSHVGRGVDHILATARWTRRVLDGIADRDASKGALAAFFSEKLMAPFQPLKFNEDALLNQYIQHTHVVEEEINRLVSEAQALLLTLQNLEDRLDVIHGIAIRDNLHVQGSKTEVLSQLWTMLGGNRSRLGKFESQLKLLNQVNTYRQNAIAHVTGTMIKLQGMGTELEELRERVGGVELFGGKGHVPLSVHIENIEMGVERLERGRRGAKELENEELRRSLDRGKDDMLRGKAIDG